MFLLAPSQPGSPGDRAIKRLLLLLLFDLAQPGVTQKRSVKQTAGVCACVRECTIYRKVNCILWCVALFSLCNYEFTHQYQKNHFLHHDKQHDRKRSGYYCQYSVWDFLKNAALEGMETNVYFTFFQL